MVYMFLFLCMVKSTGDIRDLQKICLALYSMVARAQYGFVIFV